jgi:uracil-DNA glycosylase
MVSTENHKLRVLQFRRIQQEITSCKECCNRSPDWVTRPLGVDEIPDPPPEIDILFVGVAPTAEKGPNRGKHFYSWSSDNLRRRLFQILTNEFNIPLEGMDLKADSRIFHDSKFFFVHAAKVRPLTDQAPPMEAISLCACQHLKAEIPVLNPRAICVLGHNAAFGAEAVFEQRISNVPARYTIPDCEGYVVLSPQPVMNRRNREKCDRVLELLWHVLARNRT